MSALAELRMETIFDALVAAGDVGVTRQDLYDAMVLAGCVSPGMNLQVVNTHVEGLRKMLAATGAGSDDEVITCEKASYHSTYRLALTSDSARDYRRRRAGEIRTQVQTLIEQVQTERARFAGAQVFTQAAVDYLRDALRELERGSAMTLNPTPVGVTP